MPEPGECIWLKISSQDNPHRGLSLTALRTVIVHAKELLTPEHDFGDLRYTLLSEHQGVGCSLIDLRSLTQVLTTGA